jgi:prevent-host-death family protein
MTVEVGVRALRNRLSYWLDRATGGEEVIVTEHGRPKARLSGVEQDSTLERLIAQGLVTPAKRRTGRLPRPIRVRGGISDTLRDSRGRY